MVKPWLHRLWRDSQTLQIGVDPAVGVLVSGVDPATAAWVSGLDGLRTEAEVITEAGALGVDVPTAVRVLTGLRRTGVLLPAPLTTEHLDDTGQMEPELVALSSARSPQLAAQSLADRRRRHVLIDGANRIGVPLGALLAASGIGRLGFLDGALVRRCDIGVGGLSIQDEGEPRVSAALQAIRRISVPQDDSSDALQSLSTEADLIILCRPWAAHDHAQASRVAGHRPHLAVAIREGTVVIGPLVVPGETSCLLCADLHRTDRDARWPSIAAQLLDGQNRAVHEPTSVLASLAAALAAGQALDHLDGTRPVDVLDATLEVRPPEWQLRRRPWPPHPDCDCLFGSTERAGAEAG